MGLTENAEAPFSLRAGWTVRVGGYERDSGEAQLGPLVRPEWQNGASEVDGLGSGENGLDDVGSEEGQRQQTSGIPVAHPFRSRDGGKRFGPPDGRRPGKA